MSEGVLAKRYAKALFLQAQEENVLDQVTTELKQLVEVFSDAQIQDFLLSPNQSLSAKKSLMEKATQNASSLVQRFTELLLNRRRVGLVSLIFNSLLEMEDEALGIQRATVVSVLSFDSEQSEKLKIHLERITEKKVILENRVDEKILGGVIVELGDYLIDGSIQHEIRDLRDQLRSVRVH